MFSFLARSFANLSLLLKQPLSAYCELETAHGDAPAHGAPPAIDARIEITLADGTTIRTGADVSLPALRRVMAALRG